MASGDKLASILEKALGSKPASMEPVAIQNAVRSNLMKAGKPAFVEESFLNFEEAYELILQLGGIPCYPTLADGANPICGFEAPVEQLIDNLKERNIHVAEFIPIRNKVDVLCQYVSAMREAGIVVTAGTEHNTLDLLAIEPKCVGGETIPEEIMAIFREGACVVAAHQFLSLHGREGYVDGFGNLNSVCLSDNLHIAAFSSLGAAVIEEYQKKV